VDADELAPGARIERIADVIAVPVGGELLLHDIATDRYVRLNASAAALWADLVEPRTVDELGAALAERYALAPETAIADASRAVGELVARGMAREAE
jgi:hypothetical protein